MENGTHLDSPQNSDFVHLLKVCAQQRDLQKGIGLHASILSRGLLHKKSHIASSLINMYAKCGALAQAARLLDGLPTRDVVSWNALIAGYAQQGQGDEAFNCFKRMQTEGLSPDTVTFTCVLKACGSIRTAHKGKKIHDEIAKQVLVEGNIILSTALVDMYAKCGKMTQAASLLDQLCVHNVGTWSALISGYVQQGQGEEALKCFMNMQREGHFPNSVTFFCILKACGSIRAVDEGEKVHAEIVRQGLLSTDSALGTAIVDMYAKCGELAKAEMMLDELPMRDVVAWCALITGYTQQGQGDKAAIAFEQMQHEGLSPDRVTWICILKVSGSMCLVGKIEKIHEDIEKKGLLEKDIVLGTTLIDMYAKCRALDKAAQVLDKLSFRDVISWSSLILGYAQQDRIEDAVNSFEQMQCEGISPDALTSMSLLRACNSIATTEKGEQIYHEILGQGLQVKDAMVLGNAVVDMYGKCGAVAKAEQLLDELPVRDVVSWSALIAGYTRHGKGDKALKSFDRMQQEGVAPDRVTFISVLNACGSVGAVVRGAQIHEDLVMQGFFGKDNVLGNALVDMYAKCGVLVKAAGVLNELPVRDVASWCALIAGYSHQGQDEEAFRCFEQMQEDGLSPDTIAFISLLKACESIRDIDKGDQIYNEIAQRGLLGTDDVLDTALVDMYVKCDALAKAVQVHNELPVRNAISWGLLIGGYAQQGLGEEALKCFQQMQDEGLSPNTVTLACVLSACSRSGLLDEGETHFANMSMKYGIIPDIVHHICMVVLFGRVGEFERAIAVIGKMPLSDQLPAWHALLSACQFYGNFDVGRLAFSNAIQI